jgi:fatty acid amide hydrolase 2
VDDLGPLLRLRPDVRDAVGTAARALSDRGARVEALDEPRLRRAFLYWAGALQEASDVRYADLLGGDQPTRLRRELFRYPLGRSPHIGAALALMVLERVFGVVGSRNADARRAEVDRLRSDLEARLGDDGVLLAPTWPRPAPRHRDMLRTPLDSTCTNLYNVLGFPATAVPTGFSGAGLPVGVQVVAARGRDDLCIRVAEWLESALGETSRPT